MSYQPHSDLEKLFFDEINQGTPNRIRNLPVIDLSNKDEFTLTLKKEQLLRHTSDPRPLEEGEIRSDAGLGLYDWFANYKQEAMYSTAGIRGPQNPLYPWDTRYPLSLVGVMLATLGKALVAKDKFDDAEINKIAASEVRYNSADYVDLIARIQAGVGINTFVTQDLQTIPIWMTSFLIFMLDLYGGEYVTSSHSISKKIATKDLNFQGSQYIPEESARFIAKIEDIFKEVEEHGSYQVTIAADANMNINGRLMQKINNGVPMYVEYLKNGIATNANLKLIKDNKQKIIIDCMGGCMYNTMSKILETLEVNETFDFIRTEEDPFFHGIGKVLARDSSYFDFSGDSTMVVYDHENNTYSLPVLETMDFAHILSDYPLGTCVLMADPDGDRLVTAQVEPASNKDKLNELGVLYLKLDDERILSLYLPNQSFLLTFDFQKQSLVSAGLWDDYDWFMIKTTPSSLAWDKWAEANGVPVINAPVGFKEIATVMQKVEGKIEEQEEDDITIGDIFGKEINIGKKPRLLFAGEESGGEIFGPAELIKSHSGRIAISMREKSAGEAIIITAALASQLALNNEYLSDYLQRVYETSDIDAHFDVRVDVKYYNENESDIAKLNREKEAGMQLRTQNDLFFLSLALGVGQNVCTFEQARSVIMDAFPNLDFSDMTNLSFVGDGTYLEFADKYVEVRPSGTDAISKCYSTAKSKDEAINFTQVLGNFSGERTPLHMQTIPQEFYDNAKELSLTILRKYQAHELPDQRYTPPENFDYLQ